MLVAAGVARLSASVFLGLHLAQQASCRPWEPGAGMSSATSTPPRKTRIAIPS
jgi:hypothetical protein